MYRFQTLGMLALTASDGREVHSVLTQPKRVALLAYLAVAAAQGFHRRDLLLALFWPDSDTERARNALRQAIHYLRRSLGEGVLIGRGDDELGLDPTQFACDATAFELALDAGHPAEALELYRGDLLEGFHLSDMPEWERWLESERSRLRSRAFAAASALADADEAAGNLLGAVQWARRALDLARDDEVPLRRLISLLDRGGDRAGALRAYGDFARRMGEDYGVEPSAETQALIEAVRRREIAGDPQQRSLAGRIPCEPDSAHSFEQGSSSTSPVIVPPYAERPRAGSAPMRGHSGHRLVGFLALGTLVLGPLLYGPTRNDSLSAAPEILHPQIDDSTRRPALTSVAVLPFTDLSPEQNQAYLGDGLAEELISALTEQDGLRVVARTSAFSLRGRSLDVREIGTQLSVGFVVEGSVARAKDRLRITARLVSVADGANLWSETYERDLEDVFAIQKEIASSIARKLTGGPAHGSHRSPVPRRAADPEAYDLYLRAVHFDGVSYSAQGAAKAIDHFERALKRDPNFAPAHAGLAYALLQLPNVGGMPAREAYERARQAANRAVQLDPDLADGHATLARVHYQDQQFHAAEASFRQALELSPDDPRTLYWYSLHLVARGESDRALRTARRALQRDPLSLRVHSGIGLILYYQGEYDQAVAQLGRTLELDPKYPLSHWVLGLVYTQMGAYTQAIAHLETATALSGGSPLIRATLGSAYARAGQRAAALRILDEIGRPTDARYLRPQGLVFLLSDLGRTSEALQVLGDAVADRSIHPHVLRAEPLLDPLRTTRRFQHLIKVAGLD